MNLLGSSLVGSKEGEATLSTAFQTHQKVSPHTVLYCTVLYRTVLYCTNMKVSPHTDVPHILWDFHAEGGHKSMDKLDRKVASC